MSVKKINVALVGAGVVGSSLINQLHEKHQRIIDEFAIDIRIPIILVRSIDTKRNVVDESIVFSKDENIASFRSTLTTNIDDVSSNSSIDIDVVVEVAGGIDDAYKIISHSLDNSIAVVTANKALLAQKGSELYSLATQNNVDLLFEAAVGGGIPFIRPIRESLAVEKINSVKAILNGTTNFILSQMTTNGIDYETALSMAQDLGYAESDPSADVEGLDAGAKIAIVSLLATGTKAGLGDVMTKGITQVTQDDIAVAKELGYIIKLIALVEKKNDREVFLRVEPTFVSVEHPFSTVHDGFNAVFVQGEKLGEVMFYGRGAGGDPTASAVLGDLMDASINIASNRKGAVVGYEFDTTIANNNDWQSCFYLRVMVSDEPGVLAQIAHVLAKHSVSIEVVRQNARGADANITFITHKAEYGAIIDAIADLEGLSCVHSSASLYPILD